MEDPGSTSHNISMDGTTHELSEAAHYDSARFQEFMEGLDPYSIEESGATDMWADMENQLRQPAPSVTSEPVPSESWIALTSERCEPTSGFAIQGQQFEQVRNTGSLDLLVFDHMMSNQSRSLSSASNFFSTPLTSPMWQFGTRVGEIESAMNLRAVTGVTMQEPSVSLRKQRLMSARFARSDDCMFDSVLRKARQIVLYKPEDTVIGQALLTKAGQVSAEVDILRTLSDALACKPSAHA